MRYSISGAAVILIGLLFLHSCSNSEPGVDLQGDPFFELLEATLPEIPADTVDTISQSLDVESYQLVADPETGYLIAADRVNFLLQLFDRQGTLLSTTGGEGRGPGEFNSISQLHIGYDGALYVLDGMLRRITRFEIGSGQLQYDTSFSPEPEGNIRLRDLYASEHGNFGVFYRMDDYENWEESYHLYALDEEFQPVEHLLGLPGNEKIKLTDISYLDDPVGTATYWDLDGDRLYFITSKSPQVRVYNLITGEETTETYFALDERENTRWTKQNLLDRMHAMIDRYPSYGEAIEDSSTLPMFDNFLVSGNRMLFDVFNAGGEGERLILVDLESGEAGYIQIPFYSWRFALGGDLLYIIESTEDRPYIRMLKL